MHPLTISVVTMAFAATCVDCESSTLPASQTHTIFNFGSSHTWGLSVREVLCWAERGMSDGRLMARIKSLQSGG